MWDRTTTTTKGKHKDERDEYCYSERVLELDSGCSKDERGVCLVVFCFGLVWFGLGCCVATLRLQESVVLWFFSFLFSLRLLAVEICVHFQ